MTVNFNTTKPQTTDGASRSPNIHVALHANQYEDEQMIENSDGP